MASCDAIRVVRLSNLSKDTVRLETDYPYIFGFYKDSSDSIYSKYDTIKDLETIQQMYKNVQVDTSENGLVFYLKHGDYIDLGGSLGPGFGRIKEYDLNFSKLRVCKKQDTIIVNDKGSILDLTKNEKTKYRRKIDKHYIDINHKRWANIVIR